MSVEREHSEVLVNELRQILDTPAGAHVCEHAKGVMQRLKGLIDDSEKPVTTVSGEGQFNVSLVMRRIDNGEGNPPTFLPMMHLQLKVADNPAFALLTEPDEVRKDVIRMLTLAEACDRQRDTHEDEEYISIVEKLREAINSKMYARKHYLNTKGEKKNV